jgi:hypothetical protein
MHRRAYGRSCMEAGHSGEGCLASPCSRFKLRGKTGKSQANHNQRFYTLTLISIAIIKMSFLLVASKDLRLKVVRQRPFARRSKSGTYVLLACEFVTIRPTTIFPRR